MSADIVRETENDRRAAGKLRRLREVLLGIMVTMSAASLLVPAVRGFGALLVGAVTVTGVGGAYLVGSWLARKFKPRRDELTRILRLLPFAGFGFIPGTQIDWAFGFLVAAIFLGVLVVVLYHMGVGHGRGKGGKVAIALAASFVAGLFLIGSYGLMITTQTTSTGGNTNPTTQIYGTFTNAQITSDVIAQGSVYTACASLNLPWTPGTTTTKAGVVWSSSGYTTNSVVVHSGSGVTAGALISMANTINTGVPASASGWDTFDCMEVAISVTLDSASVPIGTSGAIAVPLMVQLMSVSYTTNIANASTTGSPVSVFYRDTASGNTQYQWYMLTTNTPNGGSASNSAQLCPGAAGQYPLSVNAQTCPWVSAGTNSGAAASLVKVMFVQNAIGMFGYTSSKNQQFQIQFQVGLPNAWTPLGSATSYTVPPAVYTLTIARQ